MSPQASSSSTTGSAHKPGPKKGARGDWRRANRQLTREIANKKLLTDILGTARDIGAEFIHSASGNQVLGAAAAIIGLDILHQTRILSDFGYASALVVIASVEVAQIVATAGSAAGSVIGAVGNLIPSVGAKASSQTTPVQVVVANPDGRALPGSGREKGDLQMTEAVTKGL